MLYRKEKDFFSAFDPETGMYFRSGIFRDGKDTGEDPFMASFPELLDVGIMGHCVHGRTGLCAKAGIECYQGGLTAAAPNMNLADFVRIAEECRGNTYQFALGGCGDPDRHEDFSEILKACRANGIVPNFTTSGYGMTEETAGLCAEYCGAVAVSWYRSGYTLRAIRMLLNAGVKTNIHYVLTDRTVKEAAGLLKTHGFPDVNAVIFLLHKPVGQGTAGSMVRPGTEGLDEFLELAMSMDCGYKIGFDSCSVPMLLNHMGNADPCSLDTCEGARWSAYISADMQMMPCSFDNMDRRWAVDLREHTVAEAWRSPQFEDFRGRLRSACPGCGRRAECMGGCPICPEIVLCKGKNNRKGGQ